MKEVGRSPRIRRALGAMKLLVTVRAGVLPTTVGIPPFIPFSIQVDFHIQVMDLYIHFVHPPRPQGRDKMYI